jgi:hypothetical protein
VAKEKSFEEWLKDKEEELKEPDNKLSDKFTWKENDVAIYKDGED